MVRPRSARNETTILPAAIDIDVDILQAARIRAIEYGGAAALSAEVDDVIPHKAGGWRDDRGRRGDPRAGGPR